MGPPVGDQGRQHLIGGYGLPCGDDRPDADDLGLSFEANAIELVLKVDAFDNTSAAFLARESE